MSDAPRRTYDTTRPSLSPESQLQLFLGGAAMLLFIAAGWIFVSSGDASQGLACLSFGMVAIAGFQMLSISPAK